MDALDYARRATARGAGEILLTSMDRDGAKTGYDTALLRAVSSAVTVPVIASGGAGEVGHLIDAVKEGGADAVLGRLHLPLRRDFNRRGQGGDGRGGASGPPLNQGDKGATACTWKPWRSVSTRWKTWISWKPPWRGSRLTIAARRGADPKSSYTAQLLADPARAAKKFGEEAVETVIAAIQGDKNALAAESADLLYHWLVLLAASGVSTDAVAAKLAAREGRSGLEEKASRPV